MNLGYGAFPPYSTLRGLDPVIEEYRVEAAAGALDGLGQRVLRVRGPGDNVNLMLSASATAGVPTAFLSVPARACSARAASRFSGSYWRCASWQAWQDS